MVLFPDPTLLKLNGVLVCITIVYFAQARAYVKIDAIRVYKRICIQATPSVQETTTRYPVLLEILNILCLIHGHYIIHAKPPTTAKRPPGNSCWTTTGVRYNKELTQSCVSRAR